MECLPVSFWHDFNAVMRPFLDGEAYLAPKGDEARMLQERIAQAAKPCNREKYPFGCFPAYPKGLSFREIQIVCGDKKEIVVAEFVRQQLQEMVKSFGDHDSYAKVVAEDITLSENKEGMSVIQIPFRALLVLVVGAQARSNYLDVSLYEVDAPSGSCTVIEDVLSYHGGGIHKHLKVHPALNRLQISNEEGKTKLLEVDLTGNLVSIFRKGEVYRSPLGGVGCNADVFLVEYVKKTRVSMDDAAKHCGILLKSAALLPQPPPPLPGVSAAPVSAASVEDSTDDDRPLSLLGGKGKRKRRRKREVGVRIGFRGAASSSMPQLPPRLPFPSPRLPSPPPEAQGSTPKKLQLFSLKRAPAGAGAAADVVKGE